MPVNYLYVCLIMITVVSHVSSYEVDINMNQMDAFLDAIDLYPVVSCVYQTYWAS